VEDDDSWLNINEADFDALLEKNAAGGKAAKESMDVDKPAPSEDDLASVQAARLKDLANKVESFVEGEGDIEGARFEE